MAKFSRDFITGWNYAAAGNRIPKRWYSDEAKRGYHSYHAALPDEQIPFEETPVPAEEERRTPARYVALVRAVKLAEKRFSAFADSHLNKALNSQDRDYTLEHIEKGKENARDASVMRDALNTR